MTLPSDIERVLAIVEMALELAGSAGVQLSPKTLRTVVEIALKEASADPDQQATPETVKTSLTAAMQLCGHGA
jgi:hypothetical protein